MEFENSKTARKHEINISLEIKIKDFREATQLVSQKKYMDEKLSEYFLFSVYPSGFTKQNKTVETKDWLLVLPLVTLRDYEFRPEYDGISCIVSIIDIEGNSRYPRSFTARTESFGEKESYIRRSFILDREDKFLPEGVLTIRCDFHFDLNTVAVVIQNMDHITLRDFLERIPQELISKERARTADPNDLFADSSYTVYDYTYRILTLPQFHESRKRFGVYGIPPHSSSFSSDSKVESSDTLEHVWIFDTRPDRITDLFRVNEVFLEIYEFSECEVFLLSLDERQDDVGARLLKASPVIRRCVNAPMKERQKKRMELKNVDFATFKIVLFFIETGKCFPPCRFEEKLNLYKFCHFYEMKELQRRCAEEIVKNLTHESEINLISMNELQSDINQVERIADLYADKYLSELLDSQRQQYFPYDMLVPACFVEFKELRQRGLRAIVQSLKLPSDFQTLSRIADNFSDEYLSELLQSRRHEFKIEEQPRLRNDDNPLSDCYM